GFPAFNKATGRHPGGKPFISTVICPKSSRGMMMIRIEAQRLQDVVQDIFVAAGCSDAEGRRIGKYLVGANLAGHDSHGVARVLRYVQMKRDGAIVADQKVDVVIDTPVLAVVDGRYGFGQSVAPQAVDIGIAKCRANGLSAVA